MIDEKELEMKTKGILPLEEDDKAQIQWFSVGVGTSTEFYDAEFPDWVPISKQGEERTQIRSIEGADLGLSDPSSEVSHKPLNLRRDEIVKAFKKRQLERARRRNVFYRKIMERIERVGDDGDMDIVEWPIEEEERNAKLKWASTRSEDPNSPGWLSIFEKNKSAETGKSIRSYDSEYPDWAPDSDLPVQYSPAGHLVVNATCRPLDADFERTREFWRSTVLMER